MPASLPSQPWNILLLVHSLGPGGTERQTAELAKSLDRRLFIPHVGAAYPTGMRADELRAANIPLLELPVRSLTNRSTIAGIRILRRYLRDHQISLVHTFDAPLNVFATPWARWFGVPVVLTSQRGSRELIYPRYHRLLRFSHRVADGVVANSEFMRAHLVSEYGVPDSKIHVCYNGIDTTVFHAENRRRLDPLSSASLVIGAVGVLRPEKRLPLLLVAFADLLPLDPAMKLVVVGSGAELPALEQQAASLGIGPACVFEPATSTVAPWFRSIDIFVLPSRTEAFSNSLLEAMACGCCPLASRVGGNRELIEPNQTGLLFEAEDPADLARRLKALILDPALRQRLAAAAAEHVATRFSLPAATARMEQLYKDQLARKFSASPRST